MGAILQAIKGQNFSQLLLTHVELSVLALLIGILIAVPVAVAVRNTQVAAAGAINIGNLGRAVPSLALLALAQPFLGFGFAPSLLALTAIAISPILINTATSLKEVDPQVVDAARGMGLSEFQILARVQLPIAAPVIFAGIRTSAVQVVASATLATFIGGGGLGQLIVGGFQGNDRAMLLAGALAVAALAVITEFTFAGLERTFTPRGLKVARKRRGK